MSHSRIRAAAIAAAAAFSLAAGFPANAAPAPQTAQDFVTAIYKPYIGSSDKYYGIKLDSNAEIRKYFEPTLAALIVADDAAAAKSGDIPTLEGDAFVDAQEWQVSALKISVVNHGADKATAMISFKNFKDTKSETVQLVLTPAGWRIADIDYGGTEGTLRSLFVKSKH